MKGLDILVVRLLPFILFIIYGMNVYFACMDREPFLSYELHGNSALYSISLFIISLANKRYHCVWNRAMYIFLIIVPLFNYLDEKFYIIDTEEASIITLHIVYGLTAIITAYLAIKHFIDIRIRRIKNGNE